MKCIEFFCPPDGAVMANPDILFLEDLFLRAGSEFWSSGSGDAYLDCNDVGLSSRLEILFHNDYGFYLRYQAPGSDFNSFNPAAGTDKVQVYVGGHPLYFPASYFIDRRKAFITAMLFCESGMRADAIEWCA